MKTETKHIVLLLDSSGSMDAIKKDTIGGFNSFVKDQKVAGMAGTISLYQFNSDLNTVYEMRDIQSVEELTEQTFIPSGMTALLDAIGITVEKTGEQLSKDPVEHVFFVILTDGAENSSKEYTRERIFEMIKHQTEKYNWQFIFLGANQDSIAVAKSYGINPAAAITYAFNGEGITRGFQSVASGMACSIKSQCNFGFSPSDYEDQKNAGVTNP